MKCEKCGTEYEGNYCPKGCNSPYYKPKKPIHKRWWFWVIVVLVALFIIGSVGGNDTDEASSNDQSQTTTQTDKETNTPTDKETTTNTEKTPEPEKEPEPEKTPAQIKEDYIALCESVAYDEIARYPDTYKGKNIKFKGEIIQVSEGYFSSKNTYRIAVTEDEYGFWDDPVLVEYEIPEGSANILEEDIVIFYGECTGTTSYKSVLGSTVTIPSVEAKYIDIVQ
ncbi:MAG: hypothetical protein IJZ15_04285 [Oscillospiraceae bacterium]|nr:hypothetical protein [Oscillospiraceae bacterium]